MEKYSADPLGKLMVCHLAVYLVVNLVVLLAVLLAVCLVGLLAVLLAVCLVGHWVDRKVAKLVADSVVHSAESLAAY